MAIDKLSIATADGSMPVWRHAGEGPHGLVVLMDIYGIRDELQAMCAGFAGLGYTTYLPDLFYRAGSVSFPTDTPPPVRARDLNIATTWRMSAADIGVLLKVENHPEKLAAIGYCMGGRHAIAAAVSHPDRVVACASLHGGRMVTDDDDSSHLLVRYLQGPAYVAFAKDDRTCPPDHQALLAAEFAASKLPHPVEYFDALHGWMFPKRHCHDPVLAERARTEMLDLFENALGRAI